MPKIDVVLDASGVAAGSAQLNNQLASISDRIKEVTQVSNQYNSAGVQVGSTIRGITKDGKEFTATLGLMTKAERDLAAAGTSVANTLKSIKYTDKTKEIEELTDKSSGLQAAWERLARSGQYFLTYKAFNFIADGLTEGIEAAKELQIQLSLIRTISQGRDQQSFTAFGRDVRGVSDRTGLDVNEIAKSFYDTTSNQIAKGQGVAPFVETAAQFARVTGSQVTDSVNLLSSAINSYGLQAEDANRLSAIFFKTIDEGRIVASELANTFGRVGVLGNNLGVSVEELNAVLAITTQKGFTTSDAMTLLTNLLIKLEKPTEATAAFFRDLGVDSGEAAVKLLGFPNVLRKMVDAVKSGKVDVSAFFDEIRGRKQFGVFEQSIDDIDNFSKKLKDVKTVTQEYNEAIAIRGESPADKLQIEVNKIKNVFKADLGQEVLKVTADFVQMVGGVDNAKNAIGDLTPVVRIAAAGLAVIVPVMAAVTIANFAGAKSFQVLTASASTTARVVLPLLVGLAAYKIGESIFNGKAGNFGATNAADFDRTADAVARLRKEAELLKQSQQGAKFDPLASFAPQGQKIEDTYRGVLGILAEATKVNAQFLEDSKVKSKEAGDAMRIAFAGWLDGMKSRVSEFKKLITEANQEIEKSKKSALGFKETLQDIIFNTQLKFANDDIGEQKIKLTEGRISQIRDKIKALEKEGTTESLDQARRLFNEIATLERDNFDRSVALDKKRFEESLQANPQFRNQNGPDVFLVQTEEFQKKLNSLGAEQAAFEERIQKSKAKQAADLGVGVKSQTELNRKLEQAIDSYNKIEVFNKDGSVRPEFRDSGGKFDEQKFVEAFKNAENEVRKFAGGTLDERLKLEAQFAERKKALLREAAAQERAETLQTEQDKLLTEEETQKKKLDDLKKKRAELIAEQQALLGAFNTKLGELNAFANPVGQAGLKESEGNRIAAAINLYKESAQKLLDNKINKDGILVADPELASRAADAYRKAVDTIIEVRDNQKDVRGRNKVGPLSATDSGGRSFTPGEAAAVAKDDAQRLAESSSKLLGNIEGEKEQKRKFEEEVVKPVEKLKQLFPDLKSSAKDFTTSAGQDFNSLANGGVDKLIQKLKEVQRLLPKNQAPGGNIGLLGEESDVAYAATGGHVGLFPGQPRGRDKYPIWAERGEFIVNARSTAMYKPMLEAINRARAPQYMAQGGHVGGDTNVGDINITVNGGNTNAETGRVIGNRLERDLRRGVIRLKRN